jgi:C_GCAxxG_C_C family probable redox protein
VDSSILETAYELGYDFEKKYHGCAQCVIAAVYQLFPKMRNDDIFRSANAQGGGMGLSSQGQCGAAVGAGMVLSQLCGRQLSDLEDREGKRFQAYRLGAEFLKRFTAEVGSAICLDIQKLKMGRSFNLLDPSDWKEFELVGGHERHCPDVVGRAVRIAAQMILEQAGVENE